MFKVSNITIKFSTCFSSIVNEVIRTISSQPIFLKKRFCGHKNANQAKTNLQNQKQANKKQRQQFFAHKNF